MKNYNYIKSFILLGLIAIFQMSSIVWAVDNKPETVKVYIAKGHKMEWPSGQGLTAVSLIELIERAKIQGRISEDTQVFGMTADTGIVILDKSKNISHELRGLMAMGIKLPLDDKFIELSQRDYNLLLEGKRSLIVLKYTGGRQHWGTTSEASLGFLIDETGYSPILAAAKPSKKLKVLKLMGSYVLLLGQNPTVDKAELRRLGKFSLMTVSEIHLAPDCSLQLSSR
jgi:hypothetical protein